MFKLNCKMCKKELNQKAALVLSWPDGEDRCKKTHLCRKCYKIVMSFILGANK